MKMTTRNSLLGLALAMPVFAMPVFAQATPEAKLAGPAPDSVVSTSSTAEAPPPAATASESAAATTEEAAASAGEKQEPTVEEKELAEAKKEVARLTLMNQLSAERLQAETEASRTEVARMKAERELLTERMQLEAAKRQIALGQELAKLEDERDRLNREGELAKVKAEKLTNDLKTAQIEAQLEVTVLQAEMNQIETAEKRASYADAEPIYLKNPLREDGTLVVSDRRIPLNGPISMTTAVFVTNRINYWNNKDKEMPIFIVIDASPGGSVMAGYQILKAMESSDAPIHVVVKSFAASMAAGITTLAEQSYAFPQAIILHHQISSTGVGTMNLTQQRELFEESQRWWERLAAPVAKKMGITTDEFIREMYSRSSSGDWSEFGEQANELKWVDHIITGLEETSFVRNPDVAPEGAPAKAGVNALTGDPQNGVEQIDEDGKPFMYLPRLNPKDVYFLYNPDNYYRTR